MNGVCNACSATEDLNEDDLCSNCASDSVGDKDVDNDMDIGDDTDNDM